MENISLTHEVSSSLSGLREPPASIAPVHLNLLPDIIASAEARRRPPQAALLGIGNEGLPVMLNLTDPSPGPLLIIGDPGAGKTDLLRFVAREIAYNHYPDEVQFCTLTSFIEEWPAYEKLEHCQGILDGRQGAAAASFAGIIGQVRANPARPALLILIDDPSVLHPDALDLLHWLLQSGPAARIWPLVALNAEIAMHINTWVGRFRTRIFGRIADPDLAEEFTPAPGAGLENLHSSRAGAQFSMRSDGHWMRFRVPFS